MNNSIIKQSIKTSIVNYIGIILGAFFTVYLTPKYLTTEYNGLYRLLLEYSAIIAVYMHLGIPTVINKYYFQIFKDRADNKGFDFFVFVSPFLLMLVCFVFFIFYRANIVSFITSNEDYNLVYEYICFIIPLVISYVYFLILEAYSAMLGNILVVNIIKNVLLKIFNIVSIISFVITQDFKLSMYIVSFGTLFCLIISFWYVIKLKNYKINLKPSLDFLTHNNLISDFFRFSLFLIISNLTFFLISKIDIFFVGKYVDLSSLAYYTTASFLVSIIIIPYAAILNLSFPSIAKMYFKDGINSDLTSLVQSNATFGLAMAGYIFTLIWINIDALYLIIPNGELYLAGKYVFLILGIGKLIDISIGSTGHLLTVSKWYYVTLIFSVFNAILSLLLGFYLTKNFGILGAAYSSAFCVILSAVFQIIMVWRKINIIAFNRKSAIVAVLILLSFLIGIVIDLIEVNWFLLSVAKTLIVSMVFFGVIVKFNINDEISLLVSNFKAKIRF